MITRLFSAALRGVDAQEVEVEVNARGADKPIVMIVGKTSHISAVRCRRSGHPIGALQEIVPLGRVHRRVRGRLGGRLDGRLGGTAG